MSSDVTDTVVPVLYDADGNEIDASKLKMNINTVTITAQILNTKDVDLSFQTKGTVASGYTLKEITYSPKKSGSREKRMCLIRWLRSQYRMMC